MKTQKSLTVVIAAMCAALAVLFCFTGTVQAPSALAGFDPTASNSVNSIAVQADVTILLGGFFTTLAPKCGAAVGRNRIARLNQDGTLDATFNPNANNAVFSIAVQGDGKILIGGQFLNLSPNGGATVT